MIFWQYSMYNRPGYASALQQSPLVRVMKLEQAWTSLNCRGSRRTKCNISVTNILLKGKPYSKTDSNPIAEEIKKNEYSKVVCKHNHLNITVGFISSAVGLESDSKIADSAAASLYSSERIMSRLLLSSNAPRYARSFAKDEGVHSCCLQLWSILRLVRKITCQPKICVLPY